MLLPSVGKPVEMNLPYALPLDGAETKGLRRDYLGSESDGVHGEKVVHHHINHSRGVVSEVDVVDLATGTFLLIAQCLDIALVDLTGRIDQPLPRLWRAIFQRGRKAPIEIGHGERVHGAFQLVLVIAAAGRVEQQHRKSGAAAKEGTKQSFTNLLHIELEALTKLYFVQR